MSDKATAPSKDTLTETEEEDILMKLSEQRRRSSAGGSNIDPTKEGVEWNPTERELSEEAMHKISEKIETVRRHSRGFDIEDFKPAA